MDVILLAGGRGKRLWPYTSHTPKPFLKIFSPMTLIEESMARASEIGPIHIVGPKTILQKAKELLGNRVNYIEEKEAKDTAYAMSHVAKILHDKELLLFMPIDHLMPDPVPFYNELQNAKEIAIKGNVVAFGIQSHIPDSRFGYIHATSSGKINEFHEKPSADLAATLLKKGALINTGIYLASPSTMQSAWKKIAEKKAISFDHLVMQTLKNAYVCPVKMPFDDIGTWESLQRYLPQDEDKNHFLGRIRGLESKNTTVISHEIPVKIVGAKDLFVVATKDGILISAKNSLSKIHKL